MKTTIEKTLLVEANNDNIASAIYKIRKFAEEKGYRIIGNTDLPKNMFGVQKSIKFDSKSQQKVVRHYLTRLDKKITMMTAGKFLHFLFKKIYKLETPAPCIEYSEKELKIKAAKIAWKKMAAEAERLRVSYKTEKGDFYKTK